MPMTRMLSGMPRAALIAASLNHPIQQVMRPRAWAAKQRGSKAITVSAM